MYIGKIFSRTLFKFSEHILRTSFRTKKLCVSHQRNTLYRPFTHHFLSTKLSEKPWAIIIFPQYGPLALRICPGIPFYQLILGLHQVHATNPIDATRDLLHIFTSILPTQPGTLSPFKIPKQLGTSVIPRIPF